MSKFDIYEMITGMIIERLEAGVVPWHKPWNTISGVPQNMVSHRPYNGINFWLLISLQYDSPFFLSFKQVTDLGGFVKKGQKSIPVVFWKMREHVKQDGSIEKIPYLRYYRIFNISQVSGIDPSKIPSIDKEDFDFNEIETAQFIIDNFKARPEIQHGKSSAYYDPFNDNIGIPNQRTFQRGEDYYSTLFHEITHSTGHKSRLNRHSTIKNLNFGSHEYSQEELVAEMGAAYLCGLSGIINTTIDNTAAYIKAWIHRLKNDPKCVVIAASQAQKAVDYIINNGEEPPVPVVDEIELGNSKMNVENDQNFEVQKDVRLFETEKTEAESDENLEVQNGNSRFEIKKPSE